MKWLSSKEKLPPHLRTVLISYKGQYHVGHYDKFTKHFQLNVGNTVNLGNNEIYWTNIQTPVTH